MIIIDYFSNLSETHILNLLSCKIPEHRFRGKKDCVLTRRNKRCSLEDTQSHYMLAVSKLEKKKKHYTHCKGGACVCFVHFTHSKLCLIVPCRPVALNLCLHTHALVCAGTFCESICHTESHFWLHSISHSK